MHDEAVFASGQPLVNLEQLVLDKSSGRHFWQFTTKVPLRDTHGRVTGIVGIGRDVDRLKRVETALRQAEQEKEAILDNLMAHITLFDRDLRILWVNMPAGLNLNLSREAVIGELCYKLVFGRETPCPECPVLKAIETSRMHEFERHTDDGQVWFIRGFPYYDVDGNITGGVEISLDITSRKQAEISLREQLDFVERLFAIAPVILILLDTEGRIVRFNQYMEKLAGYTLDEVVGRDWFDVFIPERERERLRQFFLFAMQQDDMNGNLNPIVTRDGEERLIEWTNRRLIDTDGTITGLLGIGQDVTDRHRADAALREQKDFVENMFEAAPVILVMLDTEGRIVRFNQYMERAGGVLPG